MKCSIRFCSIEVRAAGPTLGDWGGHVCGGHVCGGGGRGGDGGSGGMLLGRGGVTILGEEELAWRWLGGREGEREREGGREGGEMD